jgi:hypothetical protein
MALLKGLYKKRPTKGMNDKKIQLRVDKGGVAEIYFVTQSETLTSSSAT